MNDKTINYFLKKAWYFLQQKQHVVIRGWAVLLSQLKRRTRLQFQLTQHKLIVLSHNTALEILCILHFTLYSFIGGKEQFQKNSCLTSDRKIIVVLLSTLHPPSFLWLLFFCLLYFFFPCLVGRLLVNGPDKSLTELAGNSWSPAITRVIPTYMVPISCLEK